MPPSTLILDSINIDLVTAIKPNKRKFSDDFKSINDEVLPCFERNHGFLGKLFNAAALNKALSFL